MSHTSPFPEGSSLGNITTQMDVTEMRAFGPGTTCTRVANLACKDMKLDVKMLPDMCHSDYINGEILLFLLEKMPGNSDHEKYLKINRRIQAQDRARPVIRPHTFRKRKSAASKARREAYSVHVAGKRSLLHVGSVSKKDKTKSKSKSPSVKSDPAGSKASSASPPPVKPTPQLSSSYRVLPSRRTPDYSSYLLSGPVAPNFRAYPNHGPVSAIAHKDVGMSTDDEDSDSDRPADYVASSAVTDITVEEADGHYSSEDDESEDEDEDCSACDHSSAYGGDEEDVSMDEDDDDEGPETPLAIERDLLAQLKIHKKA